jgi:hypothetical protein
MTGFTQATRAFKLADGLQRSHPFQAPVKARVNNFRRVFIPTIFLRGLSSWVGSVHLAAVSKLVRDSLTTEVEVPLNLL